MCYGKPGPRCSGHARLDLAKVRGKHPKAHPAVKAAQTLYDETPEGREILISQGKEDEAAIAKVRYMKKIDAYKADMVGKKPVDVEAVNAKHLEQANATMRAGVMTRLDALSIDEDPNADPALLNALAIKFANNATILNGILEHPNCPTVTLERLAKSKSMLLVKDAVCHPNISAKTLKQFALQNRLREGKLRNPACWAAENPMLDEEDSLRLASSDNSDIKETLAAHSSKAHILRKLATATDDDNAMLHNFAKNPLLPVDIQEKVVASNVGAALNYLAKNKGANTELLSTMSKSEDINLRETVFKNPNTNDETYFRLARDPDLKGRITINDERLEPILRKQAVEDELPPLPYNMLKAAYGFGR